MASISRDKNGRRRILFVAPNGKRPTIRLGKVSQRAAEGIKCRVEQLLEARTLKRPMDADLANWVAELEPVLADKLARVGLIPKRESATLGAFLDSYVEVRSDVKESTAAVYGHTRRCLIEFFGADKPLQDITPGDADEWRIWLGEHEVIRDGKAVKMRLADNTVARRCGIAKQFFRAAVRKGLIRRNPFAELKAGLKKIANRHHFVSRDDATKVLDACPDAEWRLLFALSRYGGLRCPSEHLAMRWGDVDWAGDRITVRSSKTEHHEGKASRVLPIFPELRPHLEAVWDVAEPGAEWVITRYRNATQNLRTQLGKIIRRAGLKPWPKLFQNLRATRETELAEQFPMHVVCEWIGNSAAIAAKHYLQVTNEHYEQASGKAAQNAAQQAHARDGDKQHDQPAAHEKPPVLLRSASSCETLQYGGMGDTGLEPVTPSLSS